MEDDFERYFYTIFNRMMNAFSSGALGVKISIGPNGDVHIDPIRPPRRKIYVPFEVVDAGEEYLVTLDIRHLPRRATSIRVLPDGVLVTAPKGERFIYFRELVDPSTASYEERDGIVELHVKKGSGEGEKVIRLPQ